MKAIKLLIGLLIVCGLMISSEVGAQDIHYSQYYASPMIVNPAMTGKFNGFYRLSFMHRSQWGSITEPLFATPSISADFSIPFKDKMKGDALGFGFFVLHDKSGGGIFNIAEFKAAIAYHKGIGRNKKTQISLGIQPAYVIKWISPDDAQFADGFVNFNPNVGWLYDAQQSQDYLQIKGQNDRVNYFDLNAGLMVNTEIGKGITLYGGYGAFHLTQPDEQFLGVNPANINTNLPMRHVAHGGAEIKIKSKFLLLPGVFYQTQAKVNEVNFGMTFGYEFENIMNGTDDLTLYFGLWHRWRDALIPKVGIDLKRFRLGFAYDFGLFRINEIEGNTISQTTSLKGLPTAFEVNITYIGNMFIPRDDVYLFNPRF